MKSVYADYLAFLKKWSKNSHFVQKNTLDDFMFRHIADCQQLLSYIPSKDLSILDIGTGAGFPGVVLAIEGCANVTLCESNQKKIIFLEELLRHLSVFAHIQPTPVEKLTQKFDIVTCRAFSSLRHLLEIYRNVSRETSQTRGLFLKGERWQEEVDHAMEFFSFDFIAHDSKTNGKSKILEIQHCVSKK